ATPDCDPLSPRPLGAKPFLPGLFFEAQSLEQSASVQLYGPCQSLGGSFGHEALEGCHVHIQSGGVEHDAVGVASQDLRPSPRQGLSEMQEGLTEAMASLLVAAVSPEKARQMLPRVHLPMPQGEVRQEPSRLLGWENEGLPRSPDTEAPQDADSQLRHYLPALCAHGLAMPQTENVAVHRFNIARPSG